MIEYEDNERIIPLFIRTRSKCHSNGVRRYNETSAWKMGFKIDEHKEWKEKFVSLWAYIDQRLKISSESSISNEAYINPKLLVWESKVKTYFNGEVPFRKYVTATGSPKIASIYKQGEKYFPQIFLNECKYKEEERMQSKSLLEDMDED